MSSIPLEHGDEVVSATRFARDGSTSTPEQVVVITKHGDVFSLQWVTSGRLGWVCKRVELRDE